ncbi:leucine-rich repeat-containing protein let-4-like [Oscarella lobularis]|uniref:leucine-rich repeat-containing protein let-4-like n=1 Tax=Oscarella lobularis TaxID=121494 RepID=UPI0033134354
MLFLSLLYLWCLLSTTGTAAQPQADVPCSRCLWLETTRKIDCASKKLRRLPPASCFPDSAISFVFAFNQIRNVDSRYFLYFSNLSAINGANNEVREPFLLPGKLKIINLSSNKIRSTLGFFQNSTTYSSLRTITLSDNKLNFLPQRAFAGLPSLLFLALNFNKIEFMEPSALINLPRLQKISLEGNAINNISKSSFSNLENLSVLILTSNKISHLQSRFLDLPSLASLYLANNMIRTVSPTAFQSLPYLRQLTLSSNFIQSIENNTFAFQKGPPSFFLYRIA